MQYSDKKTPAKVLEQIYRAEQICRHNGASLAHTMARMVEDAHYAAYGIRTCSILNISGKKQMTPKKRYKSNAGNFSSI